MSHPYEGTAVVARASSVAEAVQAIGAGAQLVDAGTDEALIAAIRREGLDVLDSGWLRYAGRGRAPEPSSLAADSPAPEGMPSDRLLVQIGPAEVAAAVAAGWRTLVDVDGGDYDLGDGDGDGDRAREDARTAAARAGAIAAICAWQGAHMVRTRHITQVRRCIDMTETILGTRPPAWAVRGLG
jgi:hypothetical protein